jgi:hypothetical protein
LRATVGGTFLLELPADTLLKIRAQLVTEGGPQKIFRKSQIRKFADLKITIIFCDCGLKTSANTYFFPYKYSILWSDLIV